jgi:hypothetical protein
MSTVESRLAAVERQLRFHRLVIVGLLVALVALVSFGARSEPELAVDSLRVGTPGAGYVVISPSSSNDAMLIGAFDHTGKTVFAMGQTKKDAFGWSVRAGSFEAAQDMLGSAAVVMDAEVDGSGAIAIRNRTNGAAMLLGANTNGDGIIDVYNHLGHKTIQLSSVSSNAGAIQVNQPNGKAGATMHGLNNFGTGGGLAIYDNQDQIQNFLGVDRNGDGMMVARDRLGAFRTYTGTGMQSLPVQ